MKRKLRNCVLFLVLAFVMCACSPLNVNNAMANHQESSAVLVAQQQPDDQVIPQNGDQKGDVEKQSKDKNKNDSDKVPSGNAKQEKNQQDGNKQDGKGLDDKKSGDQKNSENKDKKGNLIIDIIKDLS